MSIELQEMVTEKERLEGDRKSLLERLQEYQQAVTQTQQQIQQSVEQYKPVTFL